MSNPFHLFLKSARHAWFLHRKKGLRQRIQRVYGSSPDPEVRAVLTFLNNHPELDLPVGMTPPYEWTREYDSIPVPLEKEAESGMSYALVNDRRIFFSKQVKSADVQNDLRICQMEQDPRCPHSYVGRNFNVDPGDTAVFVGASNGLFCLSLIDRLAKAYLFEPSPDWREPLQKTFAPWGDKVEILSSAVGDVTGTGITSLDDFFRDRPPPQYIQVDVEGAEMSVLNGAQTLLQNARKLRLSVCTYHQRLDFERFARHFEALGYTVAPSPGYYVLGIRMPYLRRGVIYAARGVTPASSASGGSPR